MMRKLFSLYPFGRIIAAAPDGAPPRRIDDQKIKKTPCPAVPRRGPEAGVLRIHYDFHGSCVNQSIHVCFYRARYRENLV